MARIVRTRLARADLVVRAKRLQRYYKNVFDVALRPSLTKIPGGSKLRLLSKHTHNVCNAGACSVLAAKQSVECRTLGVPFDNNIDRPDRTVAKVMAGDCCTQAILPVLAPVAQSTRLVVELDLVAYAQAAVQIAEGMRASLGTRQTIDEELMKIACDSLAEMGVGATLGAPKHHICVPDLSRPCKKRATSAPSEPAVDAVDFEGASPQSAS